MYTFAASRQFFFNVPYQGRSRLIQFGDRNQAGVSVFLTDDPKLAEAIRKNSLFTRGAITEETPEGEKKKMATPKEKKIATSEGGKKELAPDVGKKMVFTNFTQAREHLCKQFKIARSKVRNPTALSRFAEEKNITIVYKPE
jgi:hypothetical protein|nr:hypothetical protein [uncultured Prevotella sp.]